MDKLHNREYGSEYQARRKANRLASHFETMVGEAQAYELAERQALALLDQGLHLGGVIRASRDEWHDR